MQFWGGEPVLGFHRLYNILPQFIEYYPNLFRFMTSTNFTLDNWEDEFFGFLKILGNYPDRRFEFSLQLSIDGPEYINDRNRGIGTTKLFLEHFYSFIENINDNLPNNVFIDTHFKQTLTEEDIKTLLTRDSFINYYKFFDELVTLFNKKATHKNIFISCNLPNTAVPGETTVADGKRFAEFTKLAYEIMVNNLQAEEPIFENYKNLISFFPRHEIECCKLNEGRVAFCGAGVHKIGMLPNEHICICHSGFVDFIEEYKKIAETNIPIIKDRCIDVNFFKTENLQLSVFPYEEFGEYQKILIALQDKESSAGYINIALLIKMLASYNQIDQKYQQSPYLEEATAFLNGILPNCIRNNINISGNLLSPPIGLIKLLLNGAKEYINAGEKFLLGAR